MKLSESTARVLPGTHVLDLVLKTDLKNCQLLRFQLEKGCCFSVSVPLCCNLIRWGWWWFHILPFLRQGLKPSSNLRSSSTVRRGYEVRERMEPHHFALDSQDPYFKGDFYYAFSKQYFWFWFWFSVESQEEFMKLKNLFTTSPMKLPDTESDSSRSVLSTQTGSSVTTPTSWSFE